MLALYDLRAFDQSDNIFRMGHDTKYRVVATSDLHGDLPEIPECDLLLIGGDLCPIKGPHYPHEQRSWLRTSFAYWLEEVPAKEIAWILGNHDFIGESPGFREIAAKLPGHYLQDDTIEIDGFKIHGFPWTPNLQSWAFFRSTERWREMTLDGEIPEADIFLMHSPIRGIGGLDGGHPEWAAPYIFNRLTYICPELIVFGHIHEGYGKRTFGEIQVANVAHMNEDYCPVNPPMVFELDARVKE